jgi:hypothetical protein
MPPFPTLQYRVTATTVVGYPNPMTCILYGLLDTGDRFCHFALAQTKEMFFTLAQRTINNEEDHQFWLASKVTHAVVCSMAIFALMACKVFGKRQLNKVGNSLHHKVLTNVDYRAVSDVILNIDPPPPSTTSECVLPPHQRRGLHTRRAVWGGVGGQYFGRRQP